MSPEEEEGGGAFYDAPNQQVVRADQSGPWEEGTGGDPGEPVAPPPPPEEPGVQQQQAGRPTDADLDAMTKAELLAYAQSQGISPANNDMTKEQIRESIDSHEGR